MNRLLPIKHVQLSITAARAQRLPAGRALHVFRALKCDTSLFLSLPSVRSFLLFSFLCSLFIFCM